jgi:uncharacterized membrane protein YheB (UPF0754 family)
MHSVSAFMMAAAPMGSFHVEMMYQALCWKIRREGIDEIIKNASLKESTMPVLFYHAAQLCWDRWQSKNASIKKPILDFNKTSEINTKLPNLSVANYFRFKKHQLLFFWSQ